MSGLAREGDEREPLLQARQNGAYQSTTEGDLTEEDITAQIEAIKEKLSSRSIAISLASISTCLFVVAIDGSLFITLLSDVSGAFSASDLSFWIGTSYMLTSCISAPIYSRLSDVYGRKNALICGVSLFLAGTSLTALAPSMLALIAARSLAGLGGGGITTTFAVILGDLIPLRKRGIYQAAAQAVFSLGSAAGGPVGGTLGDLLGWRATIAMQVPILALALFLLIFFLRLPDFPRTKQQKEREAEESQLSTLQLIQKRLDLLGCFLLAATCMVLMLGLSVLSAGNLPFSNVKVWGQLALSAVLFAVLLWYEARIATEPIINLALLKNRTVSSAVVYYFCSSVAIALFFYFPFYFRSVALQSASETGIHLISLTIATAAGSFSSGAILARINRYKFFMLFCSAIALFTPINMSTWSDETVPSRFVQNFVLAPFGFGGAAISTMMIVCVLASCNRESQATGVGLVYLARSLGYIVGISSFGAQIQYVLTAQLTKHITGPDAAELIDKIRKQSNIVATLPEDIRVIARSAYSSALRVTNISTAVIMFISLLVILQMKEIPLDSSKKKAASPSPPSDEEAGEPSTEEDVGSRRP
jgi:MFS family permease